VRSTNGVCALAGLLIALSIVSPATGEDALQFCWVQGRYDLTIYYAETEGRDDRSESFAELLRISGIDFDDVPLQDSFGSPGTGAALRGLATPRA
jgi:hypothetical protein